MSYRLFFAVVGVGVAAILALNYFSIASYDQPIETTFYLERLAHRLERVAAIPSETEAAVTGIIDVRHRSRSRPYHNAHLELRQVSAVDRIQIALRDKGQSLTQVSNAVR